MYHTPLTCYEQESLRHKAHFKAFSKALEFFASTFFKRRINKTRYVGPTGRYTRSLNR